MATNTPEDKLRYLLTVLKYTEMPQPNFNAVKTEFGINNANNAQKKYKAIIESAGFKLVNKQVVGSDGNSGNSGTIDGSASKSKPTTPVGKRTAIPSRSPAKKAAKATPASSAKKRKIEAFSDNDDEDDDINAATSGIKVENQAGHGNSDDDEIQVIGEARVQGIRARSVTVKPDPCENVDSDDDE